MIFFAKIGIFRKLIAGPLSEAKTHWMVKWLQLLNQLNFVWSHTKVSSIFVNKNLFNGPIMITIDCNSLSLLIFEELRKWFNYASGSKSAPNSDSFWVCLLFNVCVWVLQFCLFPYPPRSKGVLSEKTIFFAKIGKVMSQYFPAIFLRRKDETNYLSN